MRYFCILRLTFAFMLFYKISLCDFYFERTQVRHAPSVCAMLTWCSLSSCRRANNSVKQYFPGTEQRNDRRDQTPTGARWWCYSCQAAPTRARQPVPAGSRHEIQYECKFVCLCKDVHTSSTRKHRKLYFCVKTSMFSSSEHNKHCKKLQKTQKMRYILLQIY